MFFYGAAIFSRVVQFASDGMLGYVARYLFVGFLPARTLNPFVTTSARFQFILSFAALLNYQNKQTRYHQCRKITFIQFPFPHQQLTVALQVIMIWMFPFLFYDYVKVLWFACCLNFLCVMIYVGLHEVSRELEDPFQNTPNDIPLNTFQAQFNEGEKL